MKIVLAMFRFKTALLLLTFALISYAKAAPMVTPKREDLKATQQIDGSGRSCILHFKESASIIKNYADEDCVLLKAESGCIGWVKKKRSGICLHHISHRNLSHRLPELGRTGRNRAIQSQKEIRRFHCNILRRFDPLQPFKIRRFQHSPQSHYRFPLPASLGKSARKNRTLGLSKTFWHTSAKRIFHQNGMGQPKGGFQPAI